MVNASQKLKLGIFLVVSGAAVAVLVVAFLGVTLWKDVHHYHVLVPGSVEGLERGAPVKIRGVRVGHVGDLKLYPDGKSGVRVTLEIDPEVPVSSDAKAFLQFQGLTGNKLVNLLEGSPDAQSLEPGSYITYGETTLQKLEGNADEVVGRSLALLDKADRLLSHLVAVAEAVEVSSVSSSAEKLEQLLANLGTASSELSRLIRQGQGELRRASLQTESTLANVDQFIQGASSVTTQLARSSRELQGLIRASDVPLRSAVRDLRQASESFKELGRTLAQQPSALLFSDPPAERELP